MSHHYALLFHTDAEYAHGMNVLLSGAGIDLVAASSAAHAVALAKVTPPGVLLLDLDRPPRESMRLLGDLRSAGAKAPVLWITSKVTPAGIDRVKASGAKGILPKGADAVTAVSAVRAVLSGDDHFPGTLTNPATPGAKAEAESRRIIKLLHSFARKG